MIRKPWKSAVVGVVALLSPHVASAQQAVDIPQFELERLDLNPSGAGMLLLGSGKTLAAGGYRASLLGNYANQPLSVYRGGEKVGAAVSDRVTMHATAAFALADRFELGLQVPFIVSQSSDQTLAGQVTAPSSSGLGTPFVSGRLSLLGASADFPLDLAFQAGVGLPLGSSAAVAKSDGVLIVPKLQGSLHLGSVLAAVEAGATIRPDVANLGTSYGSEVLLGAGLATTGDGLNGELALKGGVSVAGGPSSLELLAGPRYDLTRELEFFALGGVGLGSAPGTPVFRVLAGFGYGGAPEKQVEIPVVEAPKQIDLCAPGRKHTPEMCPNNDDDEDRIKNRLDRCPREAEDRDGYQDEDGCAETDNDADGISDDKDKCPEVPGTAEYGGCPVPDQDKDGVLDADDKCVAEAGPADRQGCPFRDDDKDGVEDGSDKCPGETGLVELRGCAAKDSDGDTVFDHVDNCPAEKGTVKNRGCKAKQFVIITREKLNILDKVFFATGKAKLLPKSNKLLDQIAAILKSHPEIERVVIEGHTDDKGSAEKNRVLSQERADAVKTYLTKKGVAAERLEAKGFGPDRPADTNLTARGRENNRRVEFVIPESSPAAPAVDPTKVEGK